VKKLAFPGLKIQTGGTRFSVFIHLGGPKAHEDTAEVALSQIKD